LSNAQETAQETGRGVGNSDDENTVNKTRVYFTAAEIVPAFGFVGWRG
jgi:hypothetical protein